jgi:hypothetical protein
MRSNETLRIIHIHVHARHAPEKLLGVEHGEHDGLEPEIAMAEVPVMGEVLAQGGAQHAALLGTGEDVRQVPVRTEEAIQDLGLDAQQAVVVQLQEARQESEGIVPWPCFMRSCRCATEKNASVSSTILR